MSRILLTTASLALGTALYAAPLTADEARTPSGTLTIGWQWDASTLDPHMHRQRYTQIIAHTLRDKLFYQSPPGLTFEPLVAESITQVDDTTYQVVLKKGVLFSNGDELTSADVVYSWTRLLDPATKSPRASMANMSQIASVEAPDAYTVVFKTAIPLGPVSLAISGLGLAGQEILHKASFEALSAEEARTAKPVGLGPFTLVEWQPEQQMIMEAHKGYHRGAPGVEKLIWRSIPEEATRTAELLAGSVDMIYPVSPDFAEQLKSAGMKFEIVPGTQMRALEMNVREGSPFADIEVRRAMNMAINKDVIVEGLYQGLAVTYEQFSGVGQEGFVEGYDPYPYDPEAARAVLSKVTKPIELVVEPRWEMAAEVISEELRGYGMNVRTSVLDAAAMTAKIAEGSFDLVLAGSGFGGGTFAGAYYDLHFNCSRLDAGRIRTGFCDASLDALAQDILNQTDLAAREEKSVELTRRLAEEFVPWVPLFGEAEVWAMQPYVTGFTGSSAGMMFDLDKVTLAK